MLWVIFRQKLEWCLARVEGRPVRQRVHPAGRADLQASHALTRGPQNYQFSSSIHRSSGASGVCAYYQSGPRRSLVARPTHITQFHGKASREIYSPRPAFRLLLLCLTNVSQSGVCSP